MSFDLPDFNLLSAAWHWFLIVLAITGVTIALAVTTAALGGGQLGMLRAIGLMLRGKQHSLPWGDVKQAYGRVFRQIGGAFAELFSSSPRRIWALAMLTFKESTRRKALLVFVIFALLFMFGGWFLADAGQRADLQVKVHVAFVLTAISWLILPVALLLSCWGLPEDIKQRSLHTVVTKPVRRSEIILGRMLGYSCIGTLVLAVMGVVGYVWIDRQVPAAAHSQLTSRVPVYGNLSFLDRQGNPGIGINVGDIWDFRSYIEGASRARAVWHFDNVSPAVMVTRTDSQGNSVKRLQVETRFEAFRTHKGDIETQVFCELFFARVTREQAARALASCPGLGRLGEVLSEGDFRAAATVLAEARPTTGQYGQFEAGFREFVDVVRPYLAGTATEPVVQAADRSASAARARNGEQLAQALQDLAGLFEQQADELARRIIDVRVSIPAFQVQEFSLNVLEVDPEAFQITIEDPETGEEVQREINLFEDIVDDRKLRVEVSCVDAGQYIGVARPDLFIRTPDKPFWVGFAKSVFGIWLMMELIVVLGVTAGSLLNGPVSTFLVFALIIVGQGFRDFLQEIVRGQVQGGGVLESILRIVKHLNPTVDLEPGALTTVVKSIDWVVIGMLQLAAQIIPDFRSYSRLLEFAPNGFDVSWSNALLPSIATTVGYLIPCILIGYYCLKLRELEQK